MNKQSEYLSKKKKYFIDCIEYQIKKRVNILQKIELTKRKHERLSKDISVLKKEISEISSTISENAFETLQNTTSNDTECSQIPECQTTLPVKIEEKINTDDVVIKSERQLLFDVKSKKKLKSTIIKLFKRIIGKKITINKCRRLNKMTCQIKLNSHLDPNEKVILVEDNGNKITVKIINSSHTVLPTKKYRQYYHIDYNLADVS